LPELPEVENIALGLRKTILGKRIHRIDIRQPLILKGPHSSRWRRFMANIAGHTLTSVTRRAKRLIMTTDNRMTLLIQLGMTGKFLLRQEKSFRDHDLWQHTHMVMTLSDDVVVLYIDTRRFGRIWLLDGLNPKRPDTAMEAVGLGPLGPEALSINLTAFTRILHAQRPIKALLLDQTRIAGLGNIYADESLFAAGLHPERRCAEINDVQTRRLLQEIKAVLRRAIRAGGTTFSDFRNAYGDMGRFRSRLKVYQREGEACFACGTMIEKIVVIGRGTHFCPKCQPAG
jgi:formamidopyrimidine-DNA glycosylase